jgi:hypothetical protein
VFIVAFLRTVESPSDMIQEGSLHNLVAAANDSDNYRILNCLDLPMPWGSEERPPQYRYCHLKYYISKLKIKISVIWPHILKLGKLKMASRAL